MGGEAEAGGQGSGWGGVVCLGWVAGLATQRGGADEDGRLPAKRHPRPCPPAQGASGRAKRVASPRAQAGVACGARAGAGTAGRVRGGQWRGRTVGGWVGCARAAPAPRRAPPRGCVAGGSVPPAKGTQPPRAAVGGRVERRGGRSARVRRGRAQGRSAKAVRAPPRALAANPSRLTLRAVAVGSYAALEGGGWGQEGGTLQE